MKVREQQVTYLTSLSKLIVEQILQRGRVKKQNKTGAIINRRQEVVESHYSTHLEGYGTERE